MRGSIAREPSTYLSICLSVHRSVCRLPSAATRTRNPPPKVQNPCARSTPACVVHSFRHGRSDSPVRQTPRTEAGMAESSRARIGELPPAQGHHEGPAAEHRVRQRALPEYRRMLAPWHRHLHDSRRGLHPCLRLLRGGPRQAHDLRCRRAETGRRSGPGDGSHLRGRHLGRPRTIFPMAAPASSRRRSARCACTPPEHASRC